jgi:hypothetical protein
VSESGKIRPSSSSADSQKTPPFATTTLPFLPGSFKRVVSAYLELGCSYHYHHHQKRTVPKPKQKTRKLELS